MFIIYKFNKYLYVFKYTHVFNGCIYAYILFIVELCVCSSVQQKDMNVVLSPLHK